MSVQVTNAARRKAPWINAASWVNTNEDQISAAEVLTNANLNWTVQHAPLFADVNGSKVEVKTSQQQHELILMDLLLFLELLHLHIQSFRIKTLCR